MAGALAEQLGALGPGNVQPGQSGAMTVPIAEPCPVLPSGAAGDPSDVKRLPEAASSPEIASLPTPPPSSPPAPAPPAPAPRAKPLLRVPPQVLSATRAVTANPVNATVDHPGRITATPQPASRRTVISRNETFAMAR